MTCRYSIVLVVLGLVGLPAALQAQKKFDLPYEKFVLDNGLEVIIHEDHSDPIIAVATVVHVGSNREKPGKTGFAHFFEHMMFQGSDNVADEQHFKIVTESGGKLNGTTNLDRTNYFETFAIVEDDLFVGNKY